MSEYQFLTFGAAFESSQLADHLAEQRAAGAGVGAEERPYLQRAWSTRTTATTTSSCTAPIQRRAAGRRLGLDSRNRTLFADRGNRTAVNFRYHFPGQHGARTGWATSASSSTCRSGGTGSPSPSWTRSTTAARSARPPRSHPTSSSSAAARIRCAASREDWLGPRDKYGNPYGGNLRLVSQTS